METNKNKNGPLDVVRLEYFKESDYRALDALSYSRLSDIEKVGIVAVNAPANNISNLRGISLGSIVDNVISKRLNKIPIDIHPINKFPSQGSITHIIAHSIVKNLTFTTFNDLAEQDIVDLANKEKLYTNGINASNIYLRMKNFAEFINVLKIGVKEENLVTKFDYTIADKAIKRLHQINIFLPEYPSKRHSISGFDQNISHIEYQAMFLATINGIQFKCMLDALHFDHINKIIKPIDIKTGVLHQNSMEFFLEDCYYYYNYYIQSGMYRTIVTEYFKYHSLYKDYKVDDFEFIYSSTNPRFSLKINEPFVFTITKNMHLESFKSIEIIGVTKNKSKKPGIVELFNFYKDNVTNPSTREDLNRVIEEIAYQNLPF
jgi:hypothetical protein